MAREPGDKLIPKLIPVIRDTVIATKKGLAHHEKEVRRQATQEIIDRMGREVSSLYRPLIEHALENAGDNIHPVIKDHVEKIASGDNQWEALLGGAQMAFAGGIGGALDNLLAPLLYASNRIQPNLVPDPQSAAQAAVAGIIDFDSASNAMADQGYGQQVQNILYQLAVRTPDPITLQQLVLRGFISESDAEGWLHRSAIPQQLRGPIMRLREQLLSPADLALAVLRGNMDKGDAQSIAAKQGVNAGDFDVLIGNTGEPPGVSDMLAMYRRGIIDEQRLRHGILQSRVRNEWIPAIEAMRFQPMTTADAIDANVQNHISDQQARAIALENGLREQDYGPLRQTAGEPLSKTEMLRLHRMGKTTVEEVKQALRESRLKDKYIDHALELTTEIPPLFTTRAMLASGSITDAQAAELLKEGGYQDFVIKAVIQTAHKTKTAKTRDLTEGMLSALYLEQAITAQQFRDQLKHLGYSDAEAAQIQQIDDWRISKTARDSAVAHLHAAFVAHKISQKEAEDGLHQLLVPATMVERLINDWLLERRSAVRLLTPGQIIAAWRLKLIETATALGKLVNLGYSGPDAGLLLEIANKGPVPPGR